jgi:probable addiction module antidote protein
MCLALHERERRCQIMQSSSASVMKFIMTSKLNDFDPARYLGTEEDAAEYLNSMLEEGNTELLVATLGDVARARNVRNRARQWTHGRGTLSRTSPRCAAAFRYHRSGLHGAWVEIECGRCLRLNGWGCAHL